MSRQHALSNSREVTALFSVCEEKATNPRNKYEDWEFIMSFCDKVNEEVQG